MSTSAENKMTVPEDNAGKALISCPGHVFLHPMLQNIDPSDMRVEPLEKYNVWLNPMLYSRDKGNPKNKENHHPSSVRLCNEVYPKPSFLTMLNTMLHMFHLHGKSALQIKCGFEGLQCVFSPLFIQGVVGVKTPLTPWPREQNVHVTQRIYQRMEMFDFVLGMLHKRNTTEEIVGLSLLNGHSILAFADMEKGGKQPEGASVPFYHTESYFLRDLWFFAIETV